jgi:hypothetical protein
MPSRVRSRLQRAVFRFRGIPQLGHLCHALHILLCGAHATRIAALCTAGRIDPVSRTYLTRYLGSKMRIPEMTTSPDPDA